MKLHTHIFYIAVIIAILVITWMRIPASPPSVNQVPEQQERLTKFVSTVEANADESILALMEINQQLQLQLAEAEARLEALESQGEQEPQPSRRRLTAEEIELTPSLHERLGLDAGQLHSNPEYLMEEFESRPRDFERDTELEFLINDSFINREALRSLPTRNLQCRSGICIVDVDVSHIDDFDHGVLHSGIRNEQTLRQGWLDIISTTIDGNVRLIIGFSDEGQ